ncbi:MAG: phosphonoacetaldehyde reductase [Clostridia bacterium]|nr:phosphonoacetaldehyde reductase [Clostridia bacterium]
MNQVILFDIKKFTELLRGKKLLLVCGASFDRLEIRDEILSLNPVRFSGFSPNPKYEECCAGLKVYLEEGCEAILAVGGGSSMDTAKCIKMFSDKDHTKNYLEQEFSDTGLLLAAIPTTAGTGSESTRHSVIYYKGEKQSVSHPSLVPDYTCLIPSLLGGLPLYQKKCTMLDALCQAMESFWSVHSTEESREYSRLAIELIKENYSDYVKEDPASYEAIMVASNLAGQAINITATTAPHAMSYKLTTLYGLPHGHSVALALPGIWEFIKNNTDLCYDERGKDYLEKMLTELPITEEEYGKIMTDLEMFCPVSDNREKDLDTLVASVNLSRLKNNPVVPDEAVLRRVYEGIVK